MNNDKEMMKMVEDMGYSRPMVLAAVTKLRLDDDPVVNVKTIVHAITELTASGNFATLTLHSCAHLLYLLNLCWLSCIVDWSVYCLLVGWY